MTRREQPVVVGVSRTNTGWPVFRLRDMEGLDAETVEEYRARIERALNREEGWPGVIPEDVHGLYLHDVDFHTIAKYVADALAKTGVKDPTDEFVLDAAAVGLRIYRDQRGLR